MEQSSDVVREVEQKEVETQEQGMSAEQMQELAERVKQLEASKERILAESKEYKNRYQSLKNEVSEKEKETLEEAGNYQELLEKERNAKRELEAKTQQLRKQTLRSNLVSEVARYAPDAFDVADVMNNLPESNLVMDDEALTVGGVKEAVALVKQSKPWLFDNRRTTGMVSAKPMADVPKEETLEEKIEKDPRGMLRAALKEGGLV